MIVKNKKRSVEEKIAACGKSSNLFQDAVTGKYYLSQYRCKQLTCPSCFEQIQKNIQTNLLYAVDKHKMSYFVTVTTDDYDVDGLFARFKLLVDDLRLYNKELYFKKNRNAKAATNERNYQMMVQDAVDQEVEMMFYVCYSKKEATKTAKIERVDYHALANKRAFIKAHEVGIWQGIRKRLEIFRNQPYRFRWIYGFGKDNEPLYIEFSDYQELRDYCYMKITANTEREFAWFRTLEFQKNGRPHLHSLLNYYVNYSLLRKHFGDYIYDTRDFLAGVSLEEKDRKSRMVAGYVLKYVLKSTLDNITDTEGKLKYDFVSGSKNVKCSVFETVETSDDKKNALIFKGHFYRLAPESFTEISDPLSFIKSLPPSDLTYVNQYMLSIREEYSKIQAETKKKSLKRLEKMALWQQFQDFRTQRITEFLRVELDKRINEKSVKLSLDFAQMFKGLTVSKEHKNFIKFLNNENVKFLFLCGPAGSGKTTIISEVFTNLPSNLKVAFLSLAGKAVSRINEAVGQRVGSTIHRYCNARFSSVTDFVRNETNQIDVDLVFVDEISMLSKDVFANLLNALPVRTKIVCLGDDNQLKAVMSNSLIFEFSLLNHSAVRFVNLRQTHRNVDCVLELANKVLAGRADELEFNQYDIQKAQELVDQGYQVLTTTNALSVEINTFLSRNKKDITETAYYNYDLADEILILMNDQQNKVFNGDTCWITDYDQQTKRVQLYDPDRDYAFYYDVEASADHFQPATAFTIHKSQGSEYDNVLIILDDKDKLLTANTIYTAITRARYNVYIMIKDMSLVHLLKNKQQNEDKYNILNVLQTVVAA